MSLQHDPSHWNFTIIGVQSQVLPNSFGSINNVVFAAMLGVTLVHHLSHRASSVSRFDFYHSPAPYAVIVPSAGQCHHSLWQRMELAVALGGAPSVPAASKVVDGENGMRSRGFVLGGMMMTFGFVLCCVCER